MLVYGRRSCLVYHYNINITPSFDLISNNVPEFPGTGHKMDLFYLFGKTITKEYHSTAGIAGTDFSSRLTL